MGLEVMPSFNKNKKYVEGNKCSIEKNPDQDLEELDVVKLDEARERLLGVSLKNEGAFDSEVLDESLETDENFNPDLDIRTKDGIIKNSESLDVYIDLPEREFEDEKLAIFEEARANHFTNVFRFRNFKEKNPESSVDDDFSNSMEESYRLMNESEYQCLIDVGQEFLDDYNNIKDKDSVKAKELHARLLDVKDRAAFVRGNLSKLDTHLEIAEDKAEEIFRISNSWNTYDEKKRESEIDQMDEDLKNMDSYEKKEAYLLEKAEKDLDAMEPALKDLVFRIQEEKPDKLVFLDSSARVFAMPVQSYLSETSKLNPDLHVPKVEFFNDANTKKIDNSDLEAEFDRFRDQKVVFVDELFSGGTGANNILDAKKELKEDFSYTALSSTSGDSFVDRARLKRDDPSFKIYNSNVGGVVFSELVQSVDLGHVEKVKNEERVEIKVSKDKDSRTLARKFQDKIYSRLQGF